jgi:tetratricopeptide (TPR) repeat protein
MTLNNLGLVLRDLGERQAARKQYEEALEIYHRYMERFPQAFSHDFEGVLRNYKRLIEEGQQRPLAGDLEKLMKWVKGKLTRWLH